MVQHREPYTLEQLRQLVPIVDRRLLSIEQQHPNIRPLPALTSDEALNMIFDVLECATQRFLTDDEVFLAGQLLNQLQQSIRGELLTGTPGRYYVISEDKIRTYLEGTVYDM